MKTLIGLKNAVGDYQRANKGHYSPLYGRLMFNSRTGELWTDEFCSIGHNQWREYADPAIFEIGRSVEQSYGVVTMRTVKSYIADQLC